MKFYNDYFMLTLVARKYLKKKYYFKFVNMFNDILKLFYSRPSGSEKLVTVQGAADGVTPTNSDHIGGYYAVRPILEGIESKFGLVFPKIKSEK